jgi:hypothetical protein
MSNDLRLSRLGISGRHLPLKIIAHTKQGSAHHWKFSKTHTGQRIVHDFQPFVLCRQQAEVIQNHVNADVRNIGQSEVRHRKYERLKLGNGQVYDRFSD